MLKKAKLPPSELLFFTAGLIYLFFINSNHQHFSFCPLAMLGFDFCPGCGLGKSIHFALHGDIKIAFEAHPLGIFALFVIISRLYTLTHKYYLKTIKNKP